MNEEIQRPSDRATFGTNTCDAGLGCTGKCSRWPTQTFFVFSLMATMSDIEGSSSIDNLNALRPFQKTSSSLAFSCDIDRCGPQTGRMSKLQGAWSRPGFLGLYEVIVRVCALRVTLQLGGMDALEKNLPFVLLPPPTTVYRAISCATRVSSIHPKRHTYTARDFYGKPSFF